MDDYRDASLPEAAALLEKDRYTFSVAARIAQDPCRRIITDHERLLIVQSNEAFPVWVWTIDGATQDEMAAAFHILRAEFPPEQGFRYNVKHEFADFMIQAAAQDGVNLDILVNMLAYRCPSPIAPVKTPGGVFDLAKESDLDAIFELEDLFRREHETSSLNEEQIRQNTMRLIQAGQMYVWRDGGVASICHTRPQSGGLAGISGVNTQPDMRRRGYASNLVYQVSKILREQGHMPTLYTDADYAASNACYTQVGYQLQGSLCTVGLAKSIV